MNHLLWIFVQNTLVVAALLPIVWGLSKWRRNHPAEQHLLWLVLLVKLILPPLWAVGQFASFDSLANRLEPDIATSVSEPVDLALPATQVEHSFLIDEASEDNRSISSAAIPRQTFSEMAVDCITWFWVLGTVVFAAWTARRIVRELKLIWRSKPAPERLVERVRAAANVDLPLSRDVSPIGRYFLRLNGAARSLRLRRISVRLSSSLPSPVVLWWLHPVVLWPTSMVDITDQYDEVGILTHELEHVRRGDHLLAWLEMFVAAVHWWNPVFWLVRRQLYETREMACDAVALQDETRSRREYVETLFWLTSGQTLGSTPQAAIGLGVVSHSFFRRRLAMIFERNVNGRLSAVGLLMAASLGLLCCVGFASAQAPSAESPAAPPTTNVNNEPIGRPGGAAASEANIPPAGAASPAEATTDEAAERPGAASAAGKFFAQSPRGQSTVGGKTQDQIPAESLQEQLEMIRADIDKLILEAISAKKRKASEAAKDSDDTERRRAEDKLREAYEKVFQRYMHLKARQRGQSSAVPPSPAHGDGAHSVPLRSNTTLKHELALAELAVQERMIERDHTAKELAAISEQIAKGSATAGDQRQLEYKAKLAELAVRRAEVELAKLNASGTEKSTAKLFDSSSGNPYQSNTLPSDLQR